MVCTDPMSSLSMVLIPPGSHHPIWQPLATFNLVKTFKNSVTLDRFQVFHSHMWLVASILGIADLEHFCSPFEQHCSRKF